MTAQIPSITEQITRIHDAVGLPEYDAGDTGYDCDSCNQPEYRCVCDQLCQHKRVAWEPVCGEPLKSSDDVFCSGCAEWDYKNGDES